MKLLAEFLQEQLGEDKIEAIFYVERIYGVRKHNKSRRGRSASRIKRKNRAFVKLYGKYGK